MYVFTLCIFLSHAGFGGVYFEQIIKQVGAPSIWVKNLQLSFFAIFLAFLGAVVNDGSEILANGFFQVSFELKMA